MNTIYTVDYFINKFSAIPEDKWATGTRCQNGKRCALGWCYTSDKEAALSMYPGEVVESIEENSLNALVRHLNPTFGTGGVNNGIYPEYQQPTPKQRILAALHDIKKLQEPKVKEVIRYVSVSESLKKQTKDLIEN